MTESFLEEGSERMNGIAGVGEPCGTWVELLKVGVKNDILRLEEEEEEEEEEEMTVEEEEEEEEEEMTVVVVLTSKKSISFIK